ncbi:hypothetical protein [Streptomyces sp. NP-1717]|nr:hypothetical protein [Streptomyces sp. NP-1717]MCI3220777.1 hypothetical protein [Streptomyces sp. NP-1717]WTA76237.1 hypothetical protein OG705_26980 [Streptomyces sp. NBC_00838]
MTDTGDTTREQPKTPVWRRLLLQAAIGAAGAVGSATVTWAVYWLQSR